MPKLAAALVLSALVPPASAGSVAPAGPGACPAEGDCAASRQRDHLLLQVSAASRADAAPRGPFAPAEGFWRAGAAISGQGQWCEAHAPADGWAPRTCNSTEEVKVLTYNLYWWNLFGKVFRNGNGGSAGALIARGGSDKPYDFMGFQECEDVGRVLADAGLSATHTGIAGDHAVAIAYKTASWTLLGSGMDEVGEDRADQWWGKRGAQWARFKHVSKDKSVLVVNHHGPLPVDTGGLCGEKATAWNILKTVGTRADPSDAVVVVGDFNADVGTATVQELSARLSKLLTGRSFGGVDHVFSSCGGDAVVATRNLDDELGAGGSDHDALDVVLRV